MSSTLSELPPPPLNLWSVLSESKRIFLSQRPHFLRLSVLFLLPLSFSSHIYIHILKTHFHQRSLSTDNTTDNTTIFITVHVIYYVLSLFMSLLAVGTITFSAYHGFFDHADKLTSPLLSVVLRSFLPLLFTYLTSLFIQFLIFFVYELIVGLIIGFEFVVFKIENFYSPIVLLSCFVAVLIFLLLVFYILVIWQLQYVIVVVESSWGFEALRRSKNLVKGMSNLPLCVFRYNSACCGIWMLFFLFLNFLFLYNEFNGGGGDFISWKTWLFILGNMMSTVVGVVVMLQSYISITVLYIYCKAVNGGGEVAGEIKGTFSGVYISLPVNDEKV